MPEQKRVYQILIVDDNPADLSLMEMGLRAAPDTHLETHRLVCPKDIVSYLYRQAPYQEAVRPDLIVIDYHMATDGGASLSLLKGNPDVQQIPVLVLTGSNNPADIADVYYRHANACYAKPTDLDEYMNLMAEIVTHWLKHITLPRREDITNIHPQQWKGTHSGE